MSSSALHILKFIVDTIIYFLPALLSNAAPVIFVGKVIRRRTPIDLGKSFIDGKPIFGPSKTIEGFVSGVAMGFIVGVTYALIFSNRCFILYGTLSGLGAMIGDLLNSFVKRRVGLSSGDPFIPLDQLSFILIAYLLIRFFNPCRDVYIVTLYHFSMIIFIVMILHPLTNMFAYLLKLKDRPW